MVISSTFRHVLKTLPDNSLFWGIVDYLKGHGYRVKYDIPNVISGNTITLECHPYPRPEHLQHIKEIFKKIEKEYKK